jgi:hypothetical protein
MLSREFDANYWGDALWHFEYKGVKFWVEILPSFYCVVKVLVSQDQKIPDHKPLFGQMINKASLKLYDLGSFNLSWPMSKPDSILRKKLNAILFKEKPISTV